MSELAYAATEQGLPGLLRHGDRNSMRFSVESRVPFLTTDLADFLLGLPEDYLISSSGETKRLLRAAMRGIVPNEVLDRRDKIGFATPEYAWLRQMAPTVRGWLSEGATLPFIHYDALIAEFDAVMEGRRPFSWQVWRWVNLIRWHTHLFDS
jgi:asparagine synthase (glutamine-hydrolysing)